MIAAAILLITLGWMYGRTATGLAAEWASSPDSSYGLVLGVVAAAIAWQRRHDFRRAIDRTPPAGASSIALLFALSVFIVGQLGADLFLTRVSLVLVVVAALSCLAGGRAVRTLTAPLVFLAMAIPLPALVVNAITLPLQLVASRIAESTLMTVGVPVFRDGNVLMLPSATLEVAEACSGLRSLISLVAMGGLFAWLADTDRARRAAIVVLAVPVAIVMNGLRVAVTGVACETFGPRAASGAWHTFTGWMTFVLSLALLDVARRVIARRHVVQAFRPADRPAALKGCTTSEGSAV